MDNKQEGIKKEIESGLLRVIHPEVDNNLVELGMMGEIVVASEVSITMKVPFLEIPIKDQLIDIIKESLIGVVNDLEIKVTMAEMDDAERERFLTLARLGWKI